MYITTHLPKIWSKIKWELKRQWNSTKTEQYENDSFFVSL